MQPCHAACASVVTELVRTPPGLSSSSSSFEYDAHFARPSRPLSSHEEMLLARLAHRNRRLVQQAPPGYDVAHDSDIELVEVGQAARSVASSDSTLDDVPDDAEHASDPAEGHSLLQRDMRLSRLPSAMVCAAADSRTPPAVEGSREVQVVASNGYLVLRLAATTTFGEISQRLLAKGRRETAFDLVPIHPVFILRACAPGWVTVAVRHLPTMEVSLACVSATTDGLGLAALFGDATVTFAGQNVTAVSSFFDGMLLEVAETHLCSDPGETTPPFLEAFPCQSGAREGLPLADCNLPRNVGVADAGHPLLDSDTGHAMTTRAVLELDSLLPAHMARPHNVGICYDMVGHCTEGFELSRLCKALPSGLSVPRASWDLAYGLPNWPPCLRPIRLLIFTDGSFCQSPLAASWAVAAFADRADHVWHWAGFAAGSAPCTGVNAVYSAFEAELYALAAAFIISLNAQPTAVTCVYDSRSAAAVANCLASTAGHHPLAAAVRSLYLACLAAGIRFHFLHTYSHKGNPGNELVDALAGMCHQRPAMTQSCQDLQERLSWHEIHWIWLAASSRLDVPALQDDGQTPGLHVALPVRTGLTTPSHLAGLPEASAAEPQHVALHLATYNTLSLRSHLQQQALAALFHRQGRHVVGLQETRTDSDGVKSFGSYTAFCSPASHGTEGVQLWVDFSKPVDERQSTTPLRFVRQTFCIRYADPRRLLVTGCLGDLRLLFIVGHALTSTHTDAEIAAWWAELDMQIRRVPRGFCPVFLLDANARFQAASSNFSANAARPENANAEALQALARSHSVCLSALRDEAGRDIVSWTSPSGHAACIDFLGVPDVWSSRARTHPAPAGFCDQFRVHWHYPTSEPCVLRRDRLDSDLSGRTCLKFLGMSTSIRILAFLTSICSMALRQALPTIPGYPTPRYQTRPGIFFAPSAICVGSCSALAATSGVTSLPQSLAHGAGDLRMLDMTPCVPDNTGRAFMPPD